MLIKLLCVYIQHFNLQKNVANDLVIFSKMGICEKTLFLR